MFYLDTSFVIAAFIPSERRSSDALNWLDTVEANQLAISPWVKAEVASALSLKVRTKQIDLDQRANIVLHWEAMIAESLVLFPIQADDFENTARFVERHELALRTPDALHIAIARKANCTLITFDEHMAIAAVKLGVPVAEI